MSDRPFTNIGDDYMQAMMESARADLQEPGGVDWSKPIEIHEPDGGVYQVVLVGFDGEHLAVVRKVNYEQYWAYRKSDGSLKGGSTYRYVRNKMNVDV